MRPHPALLAQKATSGVVPVGQKYTVHSSGIWEYIRRIFATDPNRSTGVPLNSRFRNPTPGGNPPEAYDDPVTAPAGDIADNPYWKRDVRRNYAQPSTLKQADVVGLLTVGSQAAPKEDVLKIGDAGNQQLTEIKQSGEEKGLSAFFEGNSKETSAVLDSQGLPPTPPNLNPQSSEKEYQITSDHGYPAQYPCRTFV